MRHRWFFLLALLMQLPLMAQNDTVSNASPDSVPAVTDRRGHYIEAHIGAGYGSLGYQLNDPNCSTTGFISGLVQLQYAYFFHRNCGIGIGAWFTNYTTSARLGGDFVWKNDMNGNPLYDSDNEAYWHYARVQRWREREIIHNVGIPVSLQFQHLKEGKKAGFFAAIGAAPAFTVFSRYKVQEGEIKHDGYYPAWDLMVENTHEFQTKDYSNVPEAQSNMNMKLQVAVFADLGTLISLNKQTELFIGGYFNMCVTDAGPSDKQAIGWKDADYSFMNEYKGAYATSLASASRPWEAGIKIGIHWHAVKREKKAKVEDEIKDEVMEEVKEEPQPEPEPEPQPEPEPVIEQPNTEAVAVAEPEPIVEPEPEPQPQPQPKKAPAKAPKFDKVFFKYDSYELNDDAIICLRAIVPVLKNEVPDCTIILEGHASIDGDPAYNQHLSYMRAKAVAKYLTAKGIDAKRIRIIGYGSQYPNEDNYQKFRYLNRRVEIKVEQPANQK